MGKAPRKFLDADRLVVSPEYIEWHSGKRKEDLQDRLDFLGPSTQETYQPELYGKQLPEEGGWIRVLSVPYTNLGWDVPVLSMWFALPDPMNSGRIMGQAPYRARIMTPGGDLWLFPHEYTLVKDISEWVGMDPDVTLHKLDGEDALDPEHLFYLQSRGIPRQEAALLLIDDVKSQTFGWFELHPDLAAIFAGVGVPLWQHIGESRHRS